MKYYLYYYYFLAGALAKAFNEQKIVMRLEF
ncbi:hypothetical protein ES703_10435 [subsurface metagenome]